MVDIVDLFKKKEPENIVWVCHCGNTTFLLKPDYVCVCANCQTVVHAAGDDIGWSLGLLPAVPKELTEEPIGMTVLDFNDNKATYASVLRWLKAHDPAFLIAVCDDGETKTYGLMTNDENKAWFERRIERARKMICGDADAPDSQ